MNYYKLIDGVNFVGIATQCDFRKYQQKHKILLGCDENGAEYIQCNDMQYHDDWMLPVTTDRIQYQNIHVIRIEEDEYRTLEEATQNGEGIQIIEDIVDIQEEEEIVTNQNDLTTLDYIKKMKLAEMSSVCNKIITDGFDIILSDENKYHFSLTTQDQLNLITLSSLVSQGENLIPYHADGELCRFYSVDDIEKIIKTATEFKTYQVSYHNALKAYINSLDTIEQVTNINYGINIPEEYQSEVLMSLLQNM